jgi:hypothetical protein
MGRREDYTNPHTLRAESDVLSYFRAILPDWNVDDARRLKVHHDLVLRSHCGTRSFKVDVKLDGVVDRTGRILFEDYIQHDDGRIEQGWGRCNDLDFLAVVGRESGRVWMVSLPKLRHIVRYNASGDNYPATWARNRKRVEEDRMTTYGYAVPMAELQDFCSAACVLVGRLTA